MKIILLYFCFIGIIQLNVLKHKDSPDSKEKKLHLKKKDLGRKTQKLSIDKKGKKKNNKKGTAEESKKIKKDTVKKTHSVKLRKKIKKDKERKLKIKQTIKRKSLLKNEKTKVLYEEDPEKEMQDRSLSTVESTCMLSARIYPLLFYGQTQSVELKMLLRSECLSRPILQYFILPPNQPSTISFLNHPSFVELDFFGRSFKIKFETPYQRGQGFLKTLAYQFFQVYPSDDNVNFNSFDDHIVLLSPLNPETYYTMAEIKKLETIVNPYPCSIINENKIFKCVVN